MTKSKCPICGAILDRTSAAIRYRMMGELICDNCGKNQLERVKRERRMRYKKFGHVLDKEE